MNKPKHLIISRVPLFPLHLQGCQFGIYLGSQTQRLVSKVGQGRKKKGKKNSAVRLKEVVFVSVGFFFPSNRLNCLRQLSADARCWGINTAHWQHCFYFSSLCASRMWRLPPIYEISIAVSQVTSVVSHPWARVCQPTRLCWAKTSPQSGRTLRFNTRGGRRRARRERQLYLADRKKEKRHWAMKYASVTI